MTTIERVREAEKKLQDILRELKSKSMDGPDELHERLAKATDEYVKAVADLKA